MIIGVFSSFSSLLWAGIIPVESGTGRDARKSLDEGGSRGPGLARTNSTKLTTGPPSSCLKSTRLQVCDGDRVEKAGGR